MTKPIFDVQMEKVYFEIGSKTAEITCSAKSIEQPNYRWDLQNITTKVHAYIFTILSVHIELTLILGRPLQSHLIKVIIYIHPIFKSEQRHSK